MAKRAHSFLWNLVFIMRIVTIILHIYILQPDKIKREQTFEKSVAKQNKCSYNIVVIKLRNARRDEWCSTLGTHAGAKLGREICIQYEQE